MQLGRRDARGRELARELARRVLGAGEHHAAAVARGQLLHHGVAVRGRHREEVVRHVRHGLLGRVDAVRHRVVQELAHQTVDLAVEGRREEHPLPVTGRAAQQAADRREEAEVAHVVGLVEHRHLDAVEVDETLADEVLEAAGAGDQQVDALAERVGLATLADAAVDDGLAQAEDLGERGQRVADLARELARRQQHEAARTLRDGATAGQAREQRQTEREGLAAAGAAATEHVAAGQRVGDRRALDGGGLGDVARGQRVHDVTGDAEVGEGRGGTGSRRRRDVGEPLHGSEGPRAPARPSWRGDRARNAVC